MKFDIITIFPDFFNNFLSESIIKKGIDKELIEINVHDLRNFSEEPHKKVDDKPFGGGRGMVMKVSPIYNAVSSVRKKNTKVILLSPRGKKFDQKKAQKLSKISHLVLICGRYEGVDERVEENIVDESISIGDYVLMGGEIPAMVIIEAVSRLIPNILGNSELLKERISKEGFKEFPQYTRPEIFSPKKGIEWKVPKVLLSGDHKKIKKWREKKSEII